MTDSVRGCGGGFEHWWSGWVSDRADNDRLQGKFAVLARDHGQPKLALGFVYIFDPAIDLLPCTAKVSGSFVRVNGM